MAVDISRFLPQYFEESQQCMREMEQCLAALAGAPVWSGVLADKASRAAHCIKGNSGAFGFEEVAQLAGAIEHVLRKACQGFGEKNTAFLGDCEAAAAVLRGLLESRRKGGAGDAAMAQVQLEVLLEWLSATSSELQQGVGHD